MPYKNEDQQKAAQKQHYQNNKERYAESLRKNRQRKREWFEKYKSNLKCIKCGENHPALLDFHHSDPTVKELGVANALAWWGLKRVMKEIEKCDVLCCKCHRLLHWEEKQRKKIITAEKFRE